MINFFGKNPPTVNEDVAKIVEWEMKIGEITDHEYSSSDRWCGCLIMFVFRSRIKPCMILTCVPFLQLGHIQ